jgi:hypothetical protein
VEERSNRFHVQKGYIARENVTMNTEGNTVLGTEVNLVLKKSKRKSVKFGNYNIAWATLVL